MTSTTPSPSVDQSAPRLDPAPLISVVVMTYNHERFIDGAVRSVLQQTTAHPCEILIAEDYSTDETRAILHGLAAEFPGRFVILDRGRNLGLSGNLHDSLQRCRGRYIAILEGDDAWIDPRKLDRVVSAMEAHPDWTACFHACRVEDDTGSQPPYTLPVAVSGDAIRLEQLLECNVIPTYSVTVYRRGVVTEFPPWHRKLACGDWGLHILHAAHGPIGYLPDVMTAYRVHPQGMWSGKPYGDRWFEYLLLWAAVDAHFQWQYSDQIDAARKAFLAQINREVADLKQIERRYHALQLDHIAAALRAVKQSWRQLWRRW